MFLCFYQRECIQHIINGNIQGWEGDKSRTYIDYMVIDVLQFDDTLRHTGSLHKINLVNMTGMNDKHLYCERHAPIAAIHL